MQLVIGSQGGSGGTLGSVVGVYAKFTTSLDSRFIGAAEWSDNTFNTDGFLYPNALRAAEQTIVNNMIADLAGKYATDDTVYANNATKNKVLDSFFSLYRNFLAIQIASRCQEVQSSGIAVLNNNNTFFSLTLDSTRILHLTQSTSGNVVAIAASVDTNGTLTFGSPVNIVNGPAAAASTITACLVDTDKVLVCHSTGSGNSVVTVLSISVLVVSTGSSASPTPVVGNFVQEVVKIGTNRALLAYERAAGTIDFRVVTIAGTVPTVNATAVTTAYSDGWGICANSVADQVLIVKELSNVYSAALITIAGTVPSIGAFTTVPFGTSQFQNRVTDALILDSADKWILVNDDNSQNGYIRTITNSLGTITSNTPLVFDTNFSATNPYILPLGSGGYAVYSGEQASIDCWQFSLSGNTFTAIGARSETKYTYGTEIGLFEDGIRYDKVGNFVIGLGHTNNGGDFMVAIVGQLNTDLEMYNAEVPASPVLMVAETYPAPFKVYATFLNEEVFSNKFYLQLKNVSGHQNLFHTVEATIEVE